MSNVCALNRSQKRFFCVSCFTTFYSVWFVYSYLCYVELSTCPFYCGIRVTQKTNFHLMHLLWIIKFLSICICIRVISRTTLFQIVNFLINWDIYTHCLVFYNSFLRELVIFFYPLTFNYRMNSVFYSRETALWETGSKDSRLLLLYTAQNYTPILALFLFCVLVGTIT